MPLLRSQGRTRTSNKLGGGGERERESETNLSHLFVPLHDIVFDFPSVEKKSETEFTAGVLKKDQKHTKG